MYLDLNSTDSSSIKRGFTPSGAGCKAEPCSGERLFLQAARKPIKARGEQRGQAMFAYHERGRINELLLGNRFLDEGSSALLSDQSNYFWQIYAELCGLSLGRKERNGCINIQNVSYPFIKLKGMQEWITWHMYTFLCLWGWGTGDGGGRFWLSELVTLMWIRFV